MKTMLKGQVYFPIRNIVALTFIISGCSGLIHALFNCSMYTFHENSTKGRDWEKSRWLCQNSSEGDLVSIEEENEQIFVESIIKNLRAVTYFIGLKKQLSGKWKWLTNGKPVDASQGRHPWAPGEPSGEKEGKCATIYGNYRSYLGKFDDLQCNKPDKYAGYICERAVSRTKDEKAESTTTYKNVKRQSTTQKLTVSSITQSKMTSTQTRGVSDTSHDKASSGTALTQTSPVESRTKPTAKTTPQEQDAWHPEVSSGNAVIKTTATESTTQRTTMTTTQGQGPSSTRNTKEIWRGQPSGHSPAAEITSIATATTYLERPDESSQLITIIVSVLAFVILGIGIVLWFFLVYRPRKNGSKSKIRRDHRQNNITQLRREVDLSPAEEGLGDYESLPEVQRRDTCVDIEEGDRGSFLSMPQSSTKRHEEVFIKEQSSVDGSNVPLNISSTNKTSKKNNTLKDFAKNDTPEKHHVHAIVHIHPKQDKAAFHLDPVMQNLSECTLQPTVDEERCKASVGLSSPELETELTRNKETIVKQNASGQDQCNDCVYAIVDKTKKKRQPPKKPAPYHDLLYADLSHSPKKSDNRRIQQESIATVYTDIDHIKSGAMTDSRLQQENEV
ncbi:PREDICTED: uncharacterized protein LOC107342164 isoform X3 [Acropora digitifera]|uniref:uncharacterized protein LOC107342164 isoform X3 n=1 Tax=Acropora digitifera TaxID=70779 RepID=UPI00077A96EC|nr:PREDICTED: uncharacterized protein LOC107342164 isoform X3 [Acropora digitifera]